MSSGDERVGVSLRALRDDVDRLMQSGEPIPEDYLSLHGLSYVEGYVLDHDGEGDVILVGRHVPGRRSLRLDDLIVNMRCIAAGDYPFCSLDPTESGIRAVRKTIEAASRAGSVEAWKSLPRELGEAIGLQMARVGGVPLFSRAAHVMVDADYHMKRVAQGHISVPGVISCLESALESAKRQVAGGATSMSTGASMARFWFTLPDGSLRFLEADGVVWIDACDVTVSTEAELSSANGSVFDGGVLDPSAEIFARSMSREFHHAAAIVPEYSDLEDMFRLRALLLAMDYRKTLRSIGTSCASYLSGYEYRDEQPMAKGLPGLANGAQWTSRTQRGREIMEITVAPLVCGGVGMDFFVSDGNFKSGFRSFCTGLGRDVLSRRPSPRAFAWTTGA
jgi:hypothetical protein